MRSPAEGRVEPDNHLTTVATVTTIKASWNENGGSRAASAVGFRLFDELAAPDVVAKRWLPTHRMAFSEAAALSQMKLTAY